MSMYDMVDMTPEGADEGAVLSGMFGESTPVETERGIEAITEEIIFYKAVGGQAVLEIGKRLIEAKAQLKHGEWLPWLSEKVEFSEASAQRFMQLAREYENPALVRDLGASKALVLLALPASERENFAQEKHVVNGEEKSVSEMSKRELEEAIRQRKIAELKAEETARELNRQKEATAEAEAEAAKAQEAAEAARAEVEGARSISLAAQERTAELERELKELREKPVDVAVQTVDASAEQIAAAVKEAEKAAKAKRDARGKQDVEALGRFGHEGREAAQDHEDHGDDEDGLLLHVALQDADQDGAEDGHQGRNALDLLDHDRVDAHFLVGTANRRQRRRDERLHVLHDDDAQCGDLDGPAVQGTTLGVPLHLFSHVGFPFR